MPRPFWVAVPVAVPVAFWVAIRTATPSSAMNPCIAPVSAVPFSGRQGSGSGKRAASGGRCTWWKAGGCDSPNRRPGCRVRSGWSSGIRSGVRSGVRLGPDPLRLGKAVYRGDSDAPFSRRQPRALREQIVSVPWAGARSLLASALGSFLASLLESRLETSTLRYREALHAWGFRRRNPRPT
jgi:hypothetical protein